MKRTIVGITLIVLAFALLVPAIISEIQQDRLVFLTSIAILLLGVCLVVPEAVPTLRSVLVLLTSLVRGSGCGRGGEPPATPLDKFGPGSKKPEPTLEEADAGRIISSMFYTSVPTYVLNQDFHFIDWNPAFDLIFGQIPGVALGGHVSSFVVHLDDADELTKKAEEKFHSAPVDVDIEQLVYCSDRFGRMTFSKLATKVFDAHTGDTIGWNVVLNLDQIEKRQALDDVLKQKLEEQVFWAKYAASYDQVVMGFSEYRNLVQLHCDAVEKETQILDLGAGTGNVTRDLLKSGKTVTALDIAQPMLNHLRAKCRKWSGKLTVVRRNVESLQVRDLGSYDGAVMMNSLMYIENPGELLKRICQILRTNGVIALSVPHETSDVRALFKAIYAEMTPKVASARWRDHFERVKDLNFTMDKDSRLKRFSADEIMQMLSAAGLSRISAPIIVYAGQGIFVTARK